MEDYKEKYTKALDRAGNIYGASENKDILSTLATIFPELKESEDERIRKAVIEFVKQNNSFTHRKGVSKDDCLAWVEKQGEQKPTGKVEPKFKVGDKIKLAEEPKYPAREIIAIKNDAYCFDKLEQLPFINQDKWELVEQTPADKIEQNHAEWSEEDEKMLDNAILTIKYALSIPLNREDDPCLVGSSTISWLKSLKERVQPNPKQEWSEEDYNKIETIACHLDNINNEGMAETLRNIRDKYYHIIPQNIWRPSENQLKLLQTAIGIVGELTLTGINLKKLLEDLKKLRRK